jgi:hypothetical protein
MGTVKSLMAGWLIFCTSLFSQQMREPRWVTCEEACLLRMPFIEKRLGALFDTAWIPRVSFEKPAYFDSATWVNAAAHYSVDSQAFNFKAFFSAAPITWDDFGREIVRDTNVRTIGAYVREVVDHELGHALADQFSRRIGNGPWPPPFSERKGWDLKTRVGYALLYEGVAEYCGSLSVGESEEQFGMPPDTLTEKVESPLFVGFVIYGGGHWLVKPILDAYKAEGLRYIVTHPLVIGDSSRFRRTVEKYQRDALETLKMLKK